MPSTTLTDLIADARERADIESDYFTDSRLTSWAQDSLRKLHNLLVAHWGSESMSAVGTVSTVAGQRSYVWPADFDRLVRMHVVFSNRSRPMHPYSLANIILDDTPVTWTESTDIRYRLNLRGFDIDPIPADGYFPITLVYVPYAPMDEIYIAEPYLRYTDWVAWDMAIAMLAKEGTDASLHTQERALAEQRIRQDAPILDIGQPRQIIDMSELHDPRMRRFRGGYF